MFSSYLSKCKPSPVYKCLVCFFFSQSDCHYAGIDCSLLLPFVSIVILNKFQLYFSELRGLHITVY